MITWKCLQYGKNQLGKGLLKLQATKTENKNYISVQIYTYYRVWESNTHKIFKNKPDGRYMHV